MKNRQYHDFYAPIDGQARRFTMRCDDGAPNWLGVMEPIPVTASLTALYCKMDLINHLLRDLPWAVLTTCAGGNIGAVIEAAEARRAELYGARAEVA